MPMTRPLRQTGSSMVEVMVGLFVLAVGLMGALALQFSGVRGSQSAVFSSDAQIIAQEMVDRIMAYNDVLNPNDNDDYNGIDTNNVVADPGCLAAGCSSAEIRQTDLFEWKQKLQSRLPAGRGTVSYLNSIYTVVVMWDRDRTGATGTGCSGNPEVDLACYQLEFGL